VVRGLAVVDPEAVEKYECLLKAAAAKHDVGLCSAGAALLAVSVQTLCAADTVTPTFRRGATLVEFFEFPATTGDGAAKAYAVPAFPDPMAALKLFDFDELYRIGFDHMRVPLDVGSNWMRESCASSVSAASS